MLLEKKVWAAAQKELGTTGPIRVIPDSQGWVNTEKLKAILDMLHAACKAHDPLKKYVLVWDCHPTHISPAVLKHARRKKFTIILVPSKLTHLLQVLDFAVFAGLKQHLHREHLAHFVNTPTATLPLPQWITLTASSIAAKMKRVDVRTAFGSAGQARDAQPYRAAVSKWLPPGWSTTGRVLSQEELWFLIGRRQRCIHKLLFPGVPVDAAPPHAIATSTLKRLRSKTTL